MTGGVEAEGSPEPLSREPTSSQSEGMSGSEVKPDISRLRSSTSDKNIAESVSNEGEEKGEAQVRSRRRTDGGGSVTSSSPMPLPLGDEENKPKVWLSEEEMGNVSHEELLATYRRLQNYFEQVKRKGDDELNQAKESEEKHRSELVEMSRRHKALRMRLTTRERQLNETEAQISELRKSITPTVGALRSTLLDPAVNLIINKMKKEFEETKKKLEDTQNDLNAWKFTPDSNTGKRLMSKCRMLYQENEELGKMISSGRLAKLESDLALQKSLTVEMKKSQSELDELVQELDEDVEGMQSTICFLQQQLRETNKGSSTGPTSDSSLLLPTPTSNSNSCAEPGSGPVVSVSLADLCAQCRTLALTPTKPVPADTKLRTKPPSTPGSPERGDEAEGMDVDESEDRLLIVDERTPITTCALVNGELDSVRHSNHSTRTSKSTSNSSNATGNCLSVQNIVNSTVSNEDEDEGEGWGSNQGQKQPKLQHLTLTDSTDGPPVSKRTKLLEVSTTTTTMTSGHASECPSTVNGNGNGSLEH